MKWMCYGLLPCVLAACALGPDYVAPPMTLPEHFKEAPPSTGASVWQPAQPGDEQPRGAWWQMWGDAELDGLQAQLAAGNLNMRVAESQYRQAQALARTAQASLYPTVGVTAAASRSQSQSAGTALLSDRYSASVASSWEADVWGAVRRNVEASDASAQASAGDWAAVRLLQQAELSLNWLQLRALDGQKAVLTDSAEAYRRTWQHMSNRYQAGLVSSSDVALAENQYQSTQAQVLDVALQRAQLEHAIALLLGKAPAEFSLPERTLSPRVLPWPQDLSSRMVQRRPDVAAAERRVAAANAQIGVAQAAFFPSLTLSASGGWQSAQWAGLVSAPNQIWALGPTLAWNMLDGGARRAKSAQAQAAWEGAVSSYRQTVLTALKEVEDALASLRILHQEIQVQHQALLAAQRVLQTTQNQYQVGLVAYLNVLTAQNTALAAQRSANDLQTRYQSAGVNLIKALGGLW